MNPLLVIVPLVLALSGAKAQPAQSAAPEFGQPGKDVEWVPTCPALVNKMLDMAKLTTNDVLFDLGSGDGRLVITTAQRGARAHGIEYNSDLVELSKRDAAKEGVSERATFEKGDIFQSDFSNATVVTLFLSPELNMKLRPTLLAMKPGTRVVANSFDMRDWQPDQAARVEGDCQTWRTAYLWIVPARVEGRWKLANGELVLKQRFQMLSGTLTRDGESVAISNGKMDGERIGFSVGATRYSGRVNGDTMEGTAGAAKLPWSAAHGKQVHTASNLRRILMKATLRRRVPIFTLKQFGARLGHLFPGPTDTVKNETEPFFAVICSLRPVTRTSCGRRTLIICSHRNWWRKRLLRSATNQGSWSCAGWMVRSNTASSEMCWAIAVRAMCLC